MTERQCGLFISFNNSMIVLYGRAMARPFLSRKSRAMIVASHSGSQNRIALPSNNDSRDAARHVPTGSDQLQLFSATAGHGLSQRS